MKVQAKRQKQQNYKQKHFTNNADNSRKSFKKPQGPYIVPSNKQDNLQNMPTIQQLLAIPKEERLTKSTLIFEQVKPFLSSFVLKKQGSRVTQLLFKWGSNTTKTIVYKQIIKSWKELIKSKYALYTIAKVAKQFQLPGLVQDFVLLQNNKEGAQILQNFIHSNPESQVVKKLKEKIFALQKQATQSNQIKSQQYLDNMALKSIEKQYYWFTLSKLILRLRIPLMFEQQKQKTIELLVQNIANIVNDEEGVRLFIELMNNCSSKDKKNLVKQYKTHIDEIVKANNVSYISVIKLMTETDDTVLVTKSFQEEILLLIPQILTCKKAFSLIFSFFSPRNNNFNILGKYEPHVQKTTCKKSQEQRKKQLREGLYGGLIEFFQNQQNLSAIVKNPVESRLIVGMQKSMQEALDHHPEYQNFVTLILKHFLNVAKQTLNANTFSESILSDGNGSKVLKSLLLIQQDFVQFYCDQFAKLFIKHIKIVLESRASFILLGILQKGGRDNLVKQIIKSGAKFDKCIAGSHFIKLINSVGGNSAKK